MDMHEPERTETHTESKKAEEQKIRDRKKQKIRDRKNRDSQFFYDASYFSGTQSDKASKLGARCFVESLNGLEGQVGLVGGTPTVRISSEAYCGCM
ncbi:hypothetical protein Pyn_26642 [Prunus yedoensis var. nudiflora]|uniref:Uncharacterized protein n=1 Tax=Prunus yedoensis var. nudiflora TaxID=2094558 RepID=A0A314YNP0_PRUYE|nr:hypothetical protein Pyn_26642 [Prunus yedoensis var. nudiflora]